MDDAQPSDEKFREQIESCYSCCQCESYCPFFPRAFSILDEEEQTGSTGILEKAHEELISLCYDCKLCKSACPFKYDLPRIVISCKAALMSQGKLPLIKAAFRKIDEAEYYLKFIAPAVNLLLSNHLFRKILNRLTGIHKERQFPSFHLLTFRTQSILLPLTDPLLFRRIRQRSNGTARKVLYFHGCYTNYHRPQEGMAALKVLRSCGIEAVIAVQRCCGLPQLSEGFPQDAGRNMIFNLSVWRHYVDAGYDIVITSSPCSLMIKQDYPEWMGKEADFIRGHVYELSEYLLMLHNKGAIRLRMLPLHRRAAYHISCHLKAQGMGTPSLELLRLIPGLQVEVIDRGCCGLAGTMGYTTDTYDLSMKIGAPMINGILEALPDIAVSDCPKCNMQIRQGTELEAVHPIELLAMQIVDNVREIRTMTYATS